MDIPAWFFTRLDVDRGVEITLGLEIGNEIALTFLDQLVIDGVLLVHGNEIAHGAAPYVRARRTHLHDRAGRHLEDDVGAIGIGIVLSRNQLHLVR